MLRAAYNNSKRNAMPVRMATIVQTKRELTANVPNPDSRKRAPATRNAGPVIAQCRVRFRNQLTPQPIAMAKQMVVAEDPWRGYQ